MSPDPTADLHEGFVPEAVLQIKDVETLRAISDPTRMRMLEVMVQRQEPAWSVKEIAAALGVPQTRLYHHLDLLFDHGLVRPVERRVVSGIVETRYRVAALSFQLDRRLMAGGHADGDPAADLVRQTLVTVFDTARDEIETAMRSGAINPATGDERLLVTRGVARLSPARAAEYRRRLLELQDEFSDEDDPAAGSWGVVLAVYPLPSIGEPAGG